MILPKTLLENPNLRIKLLSPMEQDSLDILGNIRNKLNQIPAKDSFFADLNPFVEIPDAFAQLADHRATLGPRHEPYVRYCAEMDSKCGRQGGAFSQEKLLDLIQQYYLPANVTIPQQLVMARDLFMQMIREKIELFGRPQLGIVDHPKTFAACPTGLSKGTFSAETIGVNKVSIQKFDPTTPGQRRMRNKDRGIFMDSVVNVRAQERYLTAARNWFKTNFPEFFGAWVRPDIVVKPAMTEGVSRRFAWISWDYKSMDIHFRKKVALELIYPIYELLFPQIAISIGCHFEQNFTQPIFCGNYLIEGEHSLLSGANITNDFETLYTVLLVLALLMDPNLIKVLAALGDDMSLALKVTDAKARYYLQQAMDLSGQLDMVISPEKSGTSREEVIFCRNVYYPAAKRSPEGYMLGAYPGNLVLNNIIQPEKPIFRENTALVADLQRLDGAVGSPDWHFILTLWCKHSKYQLLRSRNVEEVCELLKREEAVTDWWSRLYGEKWDPAKSPSFHTAMQLSKKQ